MSLAKYSCHTAHAWHACNKRQYLLADSPNVVRMIDGDDRPGRLVAATEDYLQKVGAGELN